MSFDRYVSPMRTLCPICQCWTESEGQDASPVSYSQGQAYHTACLEDEVAEEDAEALRRFQWMRIANDLLLQRGVSRLGTTEAKRAYAVGTSPEDFVNGITVGALVRAEGEANAAE